MSKKGGKLAKPDTPKPKGAPGPTKPVEKAEQVVVCDNIDPTQVDEPEQSKQMSTIEKVKLMSAFTNAVENSEVECVLGNLPHGKRIYEIFVEAIDKELSRIMNGDQAAIPKQMTNALASAMSISNMCQQFGGMMANFLNSPLVEVLNLMNQRLGGNKFQYQPPDPNQMKELAEQQAQRTPPKQPAENPRQPSGPAEPAGSRGSRGAPGLGSF
jgi:hypothetical protein